MSRGFGQVERRILAVLTHEAVGVALPALAEALPDVPVRGLRQAVQRLERQGQLVATFAPGRHAERWGGVSRVKVVTLADPKAHLQDGGPLYEAPTRSYVRGRYLDRSQKLWQRMAREEFTPLPHVRLAQVYEAIGMVLHWQVEERSQRAAYEAAQRAIRPTATFQADEQRTKAEWEQARALLDQARLQLTTLIKAPHIHREHREGPPDPDLKDLLVGVAEGQS